MSGLASSTLWLPAGSENLSIGVTPTTAPSTETFIHGLELTESSPGWPLVEAVSTGFAFGVRRGGGEGLASVGVLAGIGGRTGSGSTGATGGGSATATSGGGSVGGGVNGSGGSSATGFWGSGGGSGRVATGSGGTTSGGVAPLK
jgi:hypothetical protein